MYYEHWDWQLTSKVLRRQAEQQQQNDFGRQIQISCITTGKNLDFSPPIKTIAELSFPRRQPGPITNTKQQRMRLWAKLLPWQDELTPTGGVSSQTVQTKLFKFHKAEPDTSHLPKRKLFLKGLNSWTVFYSGAAKPPLLSCVTHSAFILNPKNLHWGHRHLLPAIQSPQGGKFLCWTQGYKSETTLRYQILRWGTGFFGMAIAKKA